MKLTIEPAHLSCEMNEGQSLLEAALAAGINMPRSCRNGTCRACMCRLEAGQIRYRIEWPGLSPDEKDEGWVLPCVAVPLGDVVLSAPSVRGFPDGAGV
ncbi:MAG TPA: 2Fe-2S iron-sulfur cluster-binding protein [Aquabacterium sp.]|uniref:2Fe-2S iron-sulfur cluster-binding protein n=1 Tax=Aquabacterium sp. TaxID=1872578 RepID=UPI002E2F111C|nr:2Fe-2S iron-sulfur cluster-binding protein [Aquabacterium sp.]HEX5358249.1 2Fe-2S iron-sulfur cluster-binding protein [Aquabacterium sp.]